MCTRCWVLHFLNSFVRSDLSVSKIDQSDQCTPGLPQNFQKGLHLESFTNEKYVGK